MDTELLKNFITVTGPMGLLSYGMFRYCMQIVQECARRAADTAQVHADRLAEVLKDYADLAKERKVDRDQMLTVVKENSTAIAALTERLGHVRVDDLRGTDGKHHGD